MERAQMFDSHTKLTRCDATIGQDMTYGFFRAVAQAELPVRQSGAVKSRLNPSSKNIFIKTTSSFASDFCCLETVACRSCAYRANHVA
ncbi:hypothetical protein PF010_g20707 [Phytophthora fragariae]|uniref:Uncharacterized protein n=1 Tax=Phytophthora fragariae TaxID=53985 RepID=A0A6A3HWC8_9STRA|nr:hypothetical protein PF003_g39356 [Phytophthora fragariae]KAE8921234.1 hypothetical protein PF009_g28482 [Phytophthora fragariae]KAE8972544.1 hypothetical protein PF011_g25599 [Phytophthora fragariae]KAE9079721.1 hypothetical protein PF006_g27460 [Phytophthora fragariae]KAE9084769.1 hypothetical protein PF010_g20707 [Phytophthora fragariae]